MAMDRRVVAGGLVALGVGLGLLSAFAGPTTAPRGSAQPPLRAAAVRAVVPTQAVTPENDRTVVVGDSLLTEARPFLAAAMADPAVEIHAFPLTAPCDWTAVLDAAAADPPRVLALEFSGNALTPCMERADGGPLTRPEITARYRAAAHAITERFTALGTAVRWIDAPRGRPTINGPGRTDQFDGRVPFTVAIYESVARAAQQHGGDVAVIPAAAATLDAGRWTATLPCRAEEVALGGCGPAGTVPVRAPDGVHFCPTGLVVDGSCPVWSGGAWRYALAIRSGLTDLTAPSPRPIVP